MRRGVGHINDAVLALRRCPYNTCSFCFSNTSLFLCNGQIEEGLYMCVSVCSSRSARNVVSPRRLQSSFASKSRPGAVAASDTTSRPASGPARFLAQSMADVVCVLHRNCGSTHRLASRNQSSKGSQCSQRSQGCPAHYAHCALQPFLEHIISNIEVCVCVLPHELVSWCLNAARLTHRTRTHQINATASRPLHGLSSAPLLALHHTEHAHAHT